MPFFVFCIHLLLIKPHNQQLFAHQNQPYQIINIPDSTIPSKKLFESIDIEQLISEAQKKNLSNTAQWWALVHYKKNIFGIRSLIDDAKFFLAQDGKFNPKSELEATIRYLFSYNEKENPITRFMARYEWLKHELNAISPFEQQCQKYQEIAAFKDAIAVHLIFPTGYINSPASMFGHTLLTVQSQYNPGLLSSAINYAANTNETFGPLFAFRGIFGFYKGFFSIQPYYLKVQEYSNLENRDIWEYRLNLNQHEVKMMLYHIWELDAIYSNYYFFDENCSFNLLYLLEVVRPDTHLTDNFSFWVIPIDTIRKVIDAGMVEKATFRPSRITTMNHIISQLTNNQVKIVKAIAQNESNAQTLLQQTYFTEIQKIQVLDCASEFIQYRYANKEYTQKGYQELFINVLNVRSTFPNSINYKIPAPKPPETGHYSSHIRATVGRFESINYTEFIYRPSYHDVCDDESGFVPGSQIIFGETALRYYFDTKQLLLQRLDLINIESLSPINPLIKPLSWKVITGFERFPFSFNTNTLAYQLNTGSGCTIKITPWIMWYGMIEFSGLINSDFIHNCEVGPGVSSGLSIQPFEKIRIRYTLNDTYYLYGKAFNYITMKTRIQYNFNQQLSAHCEFINWYHKQWYNQFSAAIIFYFW